MPWLCMIVRGQQFYIPDVRQYEPYIANLYIDGKLSELSSSTGADFIGYKNVTVGEELDSLGFIKSTADIYYATFLRQTRMRLI